MKKLPNVLDQWLRSLLESYWLNPSNMDPTPDANEMLPRLERFPEEIDRYRKGTATDDDKIRLFRLFAYAQHARTLAQRLNSMADEMVGRECDLQGLPTSESFFELPTVQRAERLCGLIDRAELALEGIGAERLARFRLIKMVERAADHLMVMKNLAAAHDPEPQFSYNSVLCAGAYLLPKLPSEADMSVAVDAVRLARAKDKRKRARMRLWPALTKLMKEAGISATEKSLKRDYGKYVNERKRDTYQPTQIKASLSEPRP